ncbi:MAG: endolytic transglycosylase MltG [Ignavibacteriales bacterium]|nr:endolytic transglycosylase MltG [Ignavibacteriales bacterium]
MPIKILNIFSKLQIAIIIAVFIAIVLAGNFTFFTPNHFDKTAPYTFEVKDGESFTSVTERLYKQSIIPNKFNFKLAAFIYGAEKKIKAARFYIPNDLSYLDLLDLFVNGPADYLKPIKINDGQTLKWLGAKVKRDVNIDSAAFVNLATDKGFIKSLGLSVSTLEGYLFSKKYKVYENSSPEEAVKIFYKGFTDFFIDSLKQRAKKIGLSVHQVLTLASIIKGETNLSEEMPIISGVYHNRLRIGMRLQADPTIQYLLPGGWRRLTYADLKIESKYNTYKYSGLPPGPINNPGANAIMAALYPDKNNYLYFVANGIGGHKFAKSYSDHLKNVAQFRKWLKGQNN